MEEIIYDGYGMPIGRVVTEGMTTFGFSYKRGLVAEYYEGTHTTIDRVTGTFFDLRNNRCEELVRRYSNDY